MILLSTLTRLLSLVIERYNRFIKTAVKQHRCFNTETVFVKEILTRK